MSGAVAIRPEVLGELARARRTSTFTPCHVSTTFNVNRNCSCSDPRKTPRGSRMYWRACAEDDRLDLSAKLPSDARSTGYVYKGVAVYLSPAEQDEAIYLVGA